MKSFKILLSLHSIKLILILALAITYMAMTAINYSNNTAVVDRGGSVSKEEGNSLNIDNSRPAARK